MGPPPRIPDSGWQLPGPTQTARSQPCLHPACVLYQHREIVAQLAMRGESSKIIVTKSRAVFSSRAWLRRIGP
jgi:hypothetical protein